MHLHYILHTTAIPLPADLCIILGGVKEYCNLRLIFTFSFGAVTQTCLFVRWYKRAVQEHVTKPECQVLSIETVPDSFRPRGAGQQVPFYDVVDVSAIHDIVCVRPNKLPRENIPDAVFLVNRFILADAPRNLASE